MGTYAEFIAKRGARAFLARKLGITHSAVQQWGQQIPANRVVEVEHITGIPREALRPDLYRLRPVTEMERAA
jgi:DNA-binding transcriptional regulator YdaS (Cro superfamily)